MVIERFSGSELQGLRQAGQAAASTLAAVGALLEPGMSTEDIDRFVRKHTLAQGGELSQLGYQGFPAGVCTSLNQVVCHGIPCAEQRLADGDIINVDVTTKLNGFHGDTSRTFFVGTPSAGARHLVTVAERCRDAGIETIRHGSRLGDIGAAILELAQQHGCSVVRDYGGHGIGRVMHAPPHVPHVGSWGSGMRLKAGMALTIEPMINQGMPEVCTLSDGWTVVTCDGSLSAQFEHTVLVTESGYELLTRLR
jgi:methionyl aminopeptidase